MKLLKKVNFTFLAALITLICIASPAAAQCGFSDWDGNSDSNLDEDEFDSALEEVGYYDDWDADGDSFLSEQEWNDGIDSFGVYGTADYEDFSEWDEDEDGRLSEDEFGAGIFDTVDRDDDDSIGEDDWDWFDEEEDGLFC